MISSSKKKNFDVHAHIYTRHRKVKSCTQSKTLADEYIKRINCISNYDKRINSWNGQKKKQRVKRTDNEEWNEE